MIRELEEKDLSALTEIYNWYIVHSRATFETEPLSVEKFSERARSIQQEYPYLVLEEDEKIIGYAYLGHFNPRAAYDWSADLSIYLDQGARGHGYGTRLMQAIMKMAEKDGYVNVVSIVTEGNTASEHLHEKCGFEKIAFFPAIGYKNGQWYGVTYYVKKVNQPLPEPAHPQNLPLK